jgi:hypothetical protein
MYTNALVTRADLHTPFRGRNDARIAGEPMRLLALVPLEPEEAELKRTSGTDALFDHFAATGRDLLKLRMAKGQ